MVKKRRKKPNTNRVLFWVVILVVFGALITGYWLWSCLYSVSPRFNYLIVSIDDELLKLLDGENVSVHPQSRLKILDISTNVCFNYGIRITSRNLDVNALMFEEVPLVNLLPDRDMFAKYSFRFEVKYFNKDIGYVDIHVAPSVEDWLDKVNRTIGSERKAAVLERALAFAPEDKRIRDSLIEEYLSLKKWDVAALLLEEKAKEKPDKDVLNNLLAVYEAMNSTENIIFTLRRLIEIEPDDQDLRYRLASILEKNGREEDAIREYEKMLEMSSDSDHLSIYKTLGFLYTKIGEIQKAISAFLKAAEMDDEDVNLYYNLSTLYEKINDKDKSDLYLGRALELKKGDADGRLRLSENLIDRGEFEEAENHLKEVLKLRPDSRQALRLMIQIAEKTGNKADLKRAYERLLKLEPDNRTIIYNLGVMEYEADNLQAALPYLNRYITFFPKDKEVHSILFDIYRRQGSEDSAYKEAITLMELDPKELNYYHYAFGYLEKRNSYQEMVKIMERGVRENPGNPDLGKYLLIAYLKTERHGLAIDLIKEMLEQNPKDISMLSQLAKLQEKLERYEDASVTYKEIMDASPGDKEAEETYIASLLRLARFYENEDELEEALATYKKIIDISPNQEEAEEAYLRLRLKVLPDE